MTTTLKMNIWVEREINKFGCGISDVEHTHEVMSVLYTHWVDLDSKELEHVELDVTSAQMTINMQANNMSSG